MTRERVRLAVLGDPLAYTRSPDLHRAGLAALGRECESSAIRTPPELLGDRLAELARAGYRGVNLTIPLKAAALDHVTRVSEPARKARSINTVGFDPPAVWGDTTDGPGFVDLLRWFGRDPSRERTLFLGAGGAARSCALALIEAGGRDLVASARRPASVAGEWSAMPEAAIVAWRSEDEREASSRATLVVQATPADDPPEAGAFERLAPGALLIDLRYGPETTPWILAARAAGRHAWDGLGLLVFQARRSLELWMGCEVPLDPLAHAVGWPQ